MGTIIYVLPSPSYISISQAAQKNQNINYNRCTLLTGLPYFHPFLALAIAVSDAVLVAGATKLSNFSDFPSTISIWKVSRKRIKLHTVKEYVYQQPWNTHTLTHLSLVHQTTSTLILHANSRCQNFCSIPWLYWLVSYNHHANQTSITHNELEKVLLFSVASPLFFKISAIVTTVAIAIQEETC